MAIKVKQMKKPRIMPYAFIVSDNDMFNNDIKARIYSWMGANVGEYGSPLWDTRTQNEFKINIYFTDETDAMAFKLKFS